MQTLATGDRPLKSSGFTLIELMLVVLIISITAYFGVSLINSQSVERSIMSSAARFQHTVQYLCDKAVLENRAMGIELSHTGLAVLHHQNNQWYWVDDLQVSSDLGDFSMAILLDGLPVQLKAEPDEQPHLICQSDGSLNPFELHVWHAESDNEQLMPQGNYYVLRTIDPWTLGGAWHES